VLSDCFLSVNNFMKCYHELPCDNLAEIQKQALDYLNQIYDFQNKESLNTDLWLKINTVGFLKNNPILISWFKSLDLMIKETALTIVSDFSGAGLHIDEPPVTSKINIPLLNYQHVINEWWSVPAHIMENVQPSINQFGNQYYALDAVDISQCLIAGSVEMTGPIVFNSQIPHRIVVKNSATLPRIVLSCMFFKEPLHYLQ
jgi:hypothetical protein